MSVPEGDLKVQISKVTMISEELGLVQSHKLRGLFDQGQHEKVSWESMILCGEVKIKMDLGDFEEVWQKGGERTLKEAI